MTDEIKVVLAFVVAVLGILVMSDQLTTLSTVLPFLGTYTRDAAIVVIVVTFIKALIQKK